jgi:hypothetical protein
MNRQSVVALLTSGLTGLGATLTPAGGFLLLGWEPATVMTLYLVETLVGVPLTVGRVHYLTRGRAIPTESIPPGKMNSLQGYLIVSLGLSLVCGVFMVMFLFVLPRESLTIDAFKTGFQVMFLFQVVGFVADLVWLRGRGPDQVDNVLTASLGRVALLYFAVFIGAFLAAVEMSWFFWPFVVLKSLADLEQPIKVLAGKW